VPQFDYLLETLELLGTDVRITDTSSWGDVQAYEHVWPSLLE